MSTKMMSKSKENKVTNNQLLNILIVRNALLVFLVAPLTSSSPSPTSPSLRLSLWAGSKMLGNLTIKTMTMLMTKQQNHEHHENVDDEQHNLDDKNQEDDDALSPPCPLLLLLLIRRRPVPTSREPTNPTHLLEVLIRMW